MRCRAGPTTSLLTLVGLRRICMIASDWGAETMPVSDLLCGTWPLAPTPRSSGLRHANVQGCTDMSGLMVCSTIGLSPRILPVLSYPTTRISSTTS
ncbi:hypothetical protein PF004_g32534 [Phytophthora fragariae]|uniref:Secreted protein n=1 Tax=Phytophthora fragariae TaxID=53985 RepID=A0A6G0M6V3_9STRA|nr:hypothetical protein PF004_g32534 [Phytophthora fragariae]